MDAPALASLGDVTLSLADHAAHCRLLLRHLDIERAHVVGHSAGAAVALQLAVDAFMRNVCGPSYRTVVDRILPGAFEQAVADAAGLFQQEIPALLAWRFGPEDARPIACPVLAVAGGESPPVFGQRQQRLLEWLPSAEAFTLPEAGHLLMLEQPRALAEALAAFLTRHPM